MVKRFVDVFLVVLAAPLVLPLGLLIALATWIEGSGPVLYRSRRIGLGGKPFSALKFRTMYPDGEERLTAEQRKLFERNFKLEDDPRLTPIGRFLRSASLDELPQLINVLKGEMSLVGPRPKLPEEIDLYGPLKAELLSAPPGVTGYWQVFRSTAASDETMRRMDMYYVRNRSLLMDLQLLIRTPLVVITGRNS
jgi:lipopolysaccharide/colanic/teichoic acid biosynthesis glycosyltransferase